MAAPELNVGKKRGGHFDLFRELSERAVALFT
jgi:hypothetical protein